MSTKRSQSANLLFKSKQQRPYQDNFHKTQQQLHSQGYNPQHIPHNQISTYQKQYVRHPLNTWQKPPPESKLIFDSEAGPYRPYGNISSSYQEQFPGNQPQMREKIVPRVKNENRDVPFNASSVYSSEFGHKHTNIQKPFIKDKQFNPDLQPFSNSTTYGSHFTRQYKNPHEKRVQPQANFPSNYGFNPNTTYGNDFTNKPVNLNPSFKPVEKIGEKGDHDILTIYQQDYLNPKTLTRPLGHTTYQKISGKWVHM